VTLRRLKKFNLAILLGHSRGEVLGGKGLVLALDFYDDLASPPGSIVMPSFKAGLFIFHGKNNTPAPIDSKECSAASALQRLLRIPLTHQQSPIETEGIHR
jgi:hypothetical protein